TQGRPYPLLLIDSQVPDIDSFELAAQMREHAGAPKIIMLTSAGQRGDAARCKNLGIDAYLTKPVHDALLIDAIRTVLATQCRPPVGGVPLITRHVLRGQPQRTLHVLLAEDNYVNRLVAVKMLEKSGHTVTSVTNGKEAVSAFEQNSFDVILMDILMPEM